MKGLHKIAVSNHDKRWGKKVRERDERCCYCGSTSNLAAHHIFGRARNGTRFVLDNGITLCPAHHVFSYEFSAHKTPEKFKRWVKKYLGIGLYNYLQKKSLQITSRKKAIDEFYADDPEVEENPGAGTN